jgi:hypothetical protein
MTTVQYPCGCEATGSKPLPDYCPEHRPIDIAICMSFDAMRICLGDQPRNYSVAEVKKWFGIMCQQAETEAKP